MEYVVIERYLVTSEITNERLSDFACNKFSLLPSRKSVKKAILRGELLINGNSSTTGTWIKKGDLLELIELEIKPPKEYHLSIPVIYEDDFIAIIDKPSGISVSGNQFRTIENCLSYNLKISHQPDALKWPKPVHRLDNPTSGLLVIAKSKKAHIILGQQFEKKQIQKKYHAIVMGQTSDNGFINLPIENQIAETYFEKITEVRSLKNNFLTLLKLSPITGRTHQLRIHCAHLGFPILGDKLYGKEGNILKGKGLFLAATQLNFSHPLTNQPIELTLDAPKNFTKRLQNEELRWKKYY